MKKLGVLSVLMGVSSCAPIYKVPVGLTPQSGASVTGIVVPGSTLVSTGVHICVGAIDGALPRYGFSQACDKPILIAPGMHDIQISADFHPFPNEFGFTTVTVTLDAGQAYFIRATGGPVPFKNSNGLKSLPASGLTVWIESAAGMPLNEKTMVALQAPPPVPVIIY